jgi:hypothetical protein
VGFHPPEPFPSAEQYASRRRCPPAVSDIAFSCSEDQKVTMPRDFRALLPAKIRTRLEFKRAGRCSLGLSRSLSVTPRLAKTGGPISASRPEPVPKDGSVRKGLGETRESDLDEAERHSRSFHQDLSPGSPDDSSVPSENSDWK